MDVITAVKFQDAIQDAFAWLEQRNLRVGMLVLNPREMALLKELPAFDPVVPGLASLQGFGRYRGNLWGASVVELNAVPEGHAAVIPDGLHVNEVEAAACISLGLGVRKESPVR